MKNLLSVAISLAQFTGASLWSSLQDSVIFAVWATESSRNRPFGRVSLGNRWSISRNRRIFPLKSFAPKEIMAFGGKSLNFPLKTAISLIFGRLLAPWPKTHQILGKLASKREKCKLFWPFGPKITTFSTFDGFFPSFLEILLDFYYFALFGKIM